MTILTDEQLGLQARLDGTNINPVSFLATDYLNHFNEIIMLMEMIMDMPDCIEDMVDWQPKSYQAHFTDSAFSDKELAVEAFELAPEPYKSTFDTIICEMDQLAATAIAEIKQAVDTDDMAALEITVQGPCRELRLAAEKAGAVINGDCSVSNQNIVDELIDETIDQDAIDALFD